MNQFKYQIMLKRKMLTARIEYKFLRFEHWIQERESDMAFFLIMACLFLFEVILSLP